MKIEKDRVIRDKYHSGFKRPTLPSEIVIHGTGGGGTYQYVLNGGRAAEYKRGVALFHYLVGRGGMVVEIIDPDRWVYHSSAGQHDKKTIGIELSNTSLDNVDGYTEDQYAVLDELIPYLMKRYPIAVIRGHSRSYELFTGGRKPDPQCPGPAFDWNRLSGIVEAAGRKISLQKEEIIIVEAIS